MTRIALVTGGAGFIGSHLVEALLRAGVETHVVDDLTGGQRANVSSNATLHAADIRDGLRALAEEVRPDTIFHLAAQVDVRVSLHEPRLDADINVGGTVEVLEAAHAIGARIVFASTGGAIYGECERPAREDDERRPLAPYGTSKLCAEEYLQTYNRLYGCSHSVLRLGNVYGPRQDPHGEAGVVAIFLARLQSGQHCTVFGSGEQTRDYVYVEDVARAFVAAAEGPADTFNIGTETETSVLDLLRACSRAAGVEAAPVHAEARLGELHRSVLDVARSREVLGWQAAIPFDEGLVRTATWLRGAARQVHGETTTVGGNPAHVWPGD
jgi:UDP-glucose 4-epimerase